MASETMDQPFLRIPSSALVLSLALHICFPIMLVTVNILSENGWLPWMKKHELKKDVYQEFIQVDVVALPDELARDRKNIDMSLPIVDKPEERAERGEDDDLVDDAKTPFEKLNKAGEEIGQRQLRDKQRQAAQDKAMKKLREDAAREKAMKALAAKDKEGKKGRIKIAGNILAKGNSATGMIGTPKEAYSGLIAAKVKEHFVIYPWQQKKGLNAQVKMELYNQNGRVRTRRITKASKDKSFDSALLQAIEEAQPFPLPEDLSILDGGIEFNFTPE